MFGQPAVGLAAKTIMLESENFYIKSFISQSSLMLMKNVWLAGLVNLMFF